jgi:hypothetical protein
VTIVHGRTAMRQPLSTKRGVDISGSGSAVPTAWPPTPVPYGQRVTDVGRRAEAGSRAESSLRQNAQILDLEVAP